MGAVTVGGYGHFTKDGNTVSKSFTEEEYGSAQDTFRAAHAYLDRMEREFVTENEARYNDAVTVSNERQAVYIEAERVRQADAEAERVAAIAAEAAEAAANTPPPTP